MSEKQNPNPPTMHLSDLSRFQFEDSFEQGTGEDTVNLYCHPCGATVRSWVYPLGTSKPSLRDLVVEAAMHLQGGYCRG